jgi:UDP-N-acetylglucosamine--N-acetylmuramyl-(pentapeptide) pyrophosphoryl-undecaprenol N-acetylglucosamine transferase
VDPARLTVVALGGSLGSRRMNDALTGALSGLAGAGGLPELQVIHVTGPRYQAEVDGGARGPIRYRAVPYVGPECFAAADIVVARAGASTVAEITARGLPAVLVPWSRASTGEQVRNAEPLARAGAAVVIADADLTAERLAAVLRELLGRPEARARMGEASRRLGRPGAADDLAHIALELARRGGRY